MIPTASQTIGPFWHGLHDPALADLTRHSATGERIELVGRVFDGDGTPVIDACVELWQPGVGWGRCATGLDGAFAFRTVAAPAIAVMVLARGLLKPVWTRVYLGEVGDDIPTLARGPRDQLTRSKLVLRVRECGSRPIITSRAA